MTVIFLSVIALFISDESPISRQNQKLPELNIAPYTETTTEQGLEMSQYYVPGFVEFKFTLRFVEGFPWVVENDWRQALELLLTMENSPALQTPFDKRIFVVAKKFQSNELEFKLIKKTIHLTKDPNSLDCRIAYSPESNTFFFGKIQSNQAFLAISLYHEFQHFADLQTNPELRNARCSLEAPAYAAQVRFLLALRKKDLLPEIISAEESSDAGVYQMTYEAWIALLENRFCSWYEERLKRGKQDDPFDNTIFTDISKQK